MYFSKVTNCDLICKAFQAMFLYGFEIFDMIISRTLKLRIEEITLPSYHSRRNLFCGLGIFVLGKMAYPPLYEI